MSKITLNKSIPARKLSLSGVLTTEPEAEIPFGAIIEGVERDRDSVRFRYLGYRYRCPYDVLSSAVDRGALDAPAPLAVAVESAQLATDEPSQPTLQFITLASSGIHLQRAKVPGGWLIASAEGAVTFYPDPDHTWDGGSL